MKTPLLGLLILTAAGAQAEAVPPSLALPQGAQTCELQGWAYSDGTEEVVLRQAPDEKSEALGTVPLDAALDRTSDGQTLYPAEVTVEGYDRGWMKVSALRDEENGHLARALPPTPGWIMANAIRFNIQSGHGYEAPDPASKILINMQDEWATEVGVIEHVYACQGEWVLVDYRQTLIRDAQEGLVDLAAQEQVGKQAWFRNTCGDFFTTCDRNADK